MAFTAGEISALGFTTIDHYLKNRPEEQVAYDLPWLKKLRAKQKSFPGAKEFIVEQVKTGWGSNIQPVKGDTTVTYNKRDNVRQASFSWTGYHVGLQMNEDFLAANGITVTDDQSKAKTASRSEVHRLTNLLKDQMSDMMKGFDEDLDRKLLLDGTASADDIVGLDAFVSRTAGVTVGGLAPGTFPWWENLRAVGANAVTSADIFETMEVFKRTILRYRGKVDYIMAGGKAVDLYRTASKAAISREVQLNVSGEAPTLDPSITGLHFDGIPIVYNPSFDALDDLLSPAAADEWSKRIYMLDCSHIKLRPVEGHDGIARNPARESSNYIHRWAHTWKGSKTMNKRNCHAVISIA